MLPLRVFPLFFFVYLNLCCLVFAQGNSQFDLVAYRQFLLDNQNMNTGQLLSMYSGGKFNKNATTNFHSALYSDSIISRYNLTAYEQSLIENHGFMVTDRLRRISFGSAFHEIYNYDLPVFVSTDAILHAIHMSYDANLKNLELQLLIPKLENLLRGLRSQVSVLDGVYAGHPEMKKSIRDLDVYLTVPGKLLGIFSSPVFPENNGFVDSLMSMIQAESPMSVSLFSSTPRQYDFSQFTVRGHYTESEALGKYFKAMIWFGRTELALISPKNVEPQPSESDIQRQLIDAVLIAEASVPGNSAALLSDMDEIIKTMVGESDNVTLQNIKTLITVTQIQNAADLLDLNKFRAFQDELKSKSFAFQRINSQILISDPSNPDEIVPASAFLLLGQRFIIDSYLTGNVVFDKIKFEGKKVWRGLPSAFDVLFGLGNNASAQLLQKEFETYHYQPNLASLRYLIDSYDQGFWDASVYTSWLNAIRSLNPPEDRSKFPAFMQTAAWWQEKMNTQLASWAQLRHDNLLYAKQSYTGGTSCSYPESYVEPIPVFYRSVKNLAFTLSEKFKSGAIANPQISAFWKRFSSVADTLEIISEKELLGTMLTSVEKAFLKRMLFTQPMCGEMYNGWYLGLFFTGEEGLLKKDYVIADIHTCPTDAAGNMVGWIQHVGTGPLNLAVVTANLPDGQLVSFVGPVMSYYEKVTDSFKRMTDEEWVAEHQFTKPKRPDFVNIYLADTLGGQLSKGSSLILGITETRDNREIPETMVLGRNYPNPFNPSTKIEFSIPQRQFTSLFVYNLLGQVVKVICRKEMNSGNYIVEWDGTDDSGNEVASGTYLLYLASGREIKTRQMILIK
ncbi:MAG: DUF3160 domain-containing protein [Bacteroidetes bacterium]|nr:DUF3160 domain-containing protein [Bacteroidota bacterium]